MSKKALIEKYTKQFEKIKEIYGDVEDAHGTADGLLIDLLNELGYEEITALWIKVPKWYA